MLIKDIFEDEGALWNEGVISWISINRYSYQGNRVQVVDGSFRPCVGKYLWAPFQAYSYFFEFLIKKIQKQKKQDCMQTYLFLAIDNLNRQSSWGPTYLYVYTSNTT